MIKKPFRLRSEKYLKSIRTKPCLVCGGRAEAHHLTFAQARAMGRKNGDQHTVPLCHSHHMEMHHFAGGERVWWACQGIDPLRWSKDNFAKWVKENGTDEQPDID